MARVITHGNRVTDTTETITCPICGCVFEITDADRKPGASGLESYSVVHCPECYETIRCQESRQQIRDARAAVGEKLIEEITEYVEWDKIHEMMVATNWTWATTDNEVPSTEQIKESARARLREAWREKSSSYSGGIYAGYDTEENADGEEEEVLKFEFRIEQAHAYWTTKGEIEIY